MAKSVFKSLRSGFLDKLCSELLAYRVKDKKQTDVLNIADGKSKASKTIATALLSELNRPLAEKPLSGQATGDRFESILADYLKSCFEHLAHVRPGNWHFSTLVGSLGIAAFDQYLHLGELAKLLKDRPSIKTAMGDYLVKPDVVVARRPITDREFNLNELLINSNDLIAEHSSLRHRGEDEEDPPPLLHASISCKWTMRSDRAQNSRTEALNLIRNRKGPTPHIVAITFEPLPTRLRSIAMGTGDLDCTYHVCLHELRNAVEAVGSKGQRTVLDELVLGRRLRDVSDLPLDLAT